MHRKAGMLGARGAVQRGEARLDGRNWWLSQCWRDLRWMYDAGISGQVHAFYESAAGFAIVFGGGANLWTRNSRLAALHAIVDEQGTELAETDAPPVAGKLNC